jgi:hypothetical protein
MILEISPNPTGATDFLVALARCTSHDRSGKAFEHNRKHLESYHRLQHGIEVGYESS